MKRPPSRAPRASGRPSLSGEATRERILDAAEALFAAEGVGATSVRAITASAGVNLAAVHYHFGGKDELLDAVLARRIAPINQERQKLLDQVRAARAPAAPSVREVLEAFLRPVMRHLAMDEDGVERVGRILARCEQEEPERVDDRVMRQFRSSGEAFLGALCEALPATPVPLVHERFRFAIGVMTHALAWRRRRSPLAFPLPGDGPEALLERMIVFLDAAFRAPSPALDEETRHALG